MFVFDHWVTVNLLLLIFFVHILTFAIDLTIQIFINIPHNVPRSLMLLFWMCVYSSGAALVDFGETMKRMAEVKDSLDIDVKQNFIDPLQAVAEKDIKDIQVESER